MAGTASQAVRDSVARCRDRGLTPVFWWRDDDLIADSPNFRHLASTARDRQIECLVAAIPALCEDGLGAAVNETSQIIIGQHGFRHENHAAEGAAKSEFGAERPSAEVYDEICDGFLRLQSLFGARFAPVFVGPWNRCAPSHASALIDVGLKGWSGIASEPSRPDHPKLRRVDVHVDIVEWTASPKVQPLEQICGKLAHAITEVELRSASLPSANSAVARAVEVPIGVLTHHRVFDDEGWSVLSRLMALITEDCGAEWSSPRGLFRLNAEPASEAPA